MKPADCPLTRESSVSPLLFRQPRTRIGLPAVLLSDVLGQPLRLDQLAALSSRLVTEYSGAHGYVDSWGHVLEKHLGQFVILTFVPLELWASTTEERRCAGRAIASLVPGAHHAARPGLTHDIPRGIHLPGAARAGRLHVSALFHLIVPATDVAAFMVWAEGVLLPDLLPEALSRATAQVKWELARGLACRPPRLPTTQ